MTTLPWASASLSGIFAGVVAVLATVCIEKLGGTVGGVLATSPTTIVAACMGLYAQFGGTAKLVEALAHVPFGMIVDAVFLLVWKEVPPRLPGSLSTLGVLGITTAASLLVWCEFVRVKVLSSRELRRVPLLASRL